jgi:hypothetical protein
LPRQGKRNGTTAAGTKHWGNAVLMLLTGFLLVVDLALAAMLLLHAACAW